jgi:archaellum component FlaG (FlaF/FlaG flagellin family)
VSSTIEGFRDHNTGQDTDYWLALDGARRTLAEKAPASPDVRPCQMIAWFTDGKLDYSTRSDVDKPYAPGRSLDTDADRAAMTRTAQESICRAGGVADQLRSSGIVTIAIGLNGGQSQDDDFDLLKAISTGQSTSIGSCGAVNRPVPGDFYLAQNIDDLLFAFDNLSTPGQPPLSSEAGACVVQVCDSGKHRFVLDSSVGSVSVLAAADHPGLVPVLVAPNGRQIRMQPGSPGNTDVGGVAVNYSFPSDKAVSVRMTNSDAQLWTGAWALVFIAPDNAAARTRSSIHITGDLKP